jgi:hypothetical protein
MRNDEIRKLTIELLHKEGIKIVEENIKIWNCESMRASDVKSGCDFVKREGLNPVLVYTNNVPLKDYIEQAENVRIFEREELTVLAIRHNSDLLKWL